MFRVPLSRTLLVCAAEVEMASFSEEGRKSAFVRLSTGAMMPQLALGTWQTPKQDGK